MKLLTNPFLLRVAAVFFAGAFAFLLGLFLMKQVRRSVQEEALLREGDPSTENFALHTYHAVIQQLKQQKHELQALQQVERRRAKTTESISAAVLSNLSCGVLFFNSTGLVRQANPAAKNILGLAGLIGMNADELFRGTVVRCSESSEQIAPTLAEAIQSTLQRAGGVRRVESVYRTRGGEERVLAVTVSPVYAANAELLGVTCLINDETELVQMRTKRELHGDISAESVLELRHSVSVISRHAKKLAAGCDPKNMERSASAIACEAERLERSIAGFLRKAEAAPAGSEAS
ncbi:MAG TPA: PAS domain-containing protein [Terriglobales bacterium]|nr:PAS domain-containing protein [Terriglobales bacterium]